MDTTGHAIGKLEGKIALTALPPHRGLVVNLCLLAVSGPDAPAPFEGNPPAEAITDCAKVFEHVALDKESQATMLEHSFLIERPVGYYYMQLRVILFRLHNGKWFAQAEQFFYSRRPFHITAQAQDGLTLPASWPTTPLDELPLYGTMSPQRKRPWWKLF